MEKVTEILGARVFTEDGAYLGRVVELRSAGEPEHGEPNKTRELSDLVVARTSVAELIDLKKTKALVIPWKSVKTFKDKKIVLELMPAE
ncbi:MAG TPA: hypothetical protein VJT50_07370 [Pyrinomonadaceae bacterium]|nr:hypothetical protein [Pyrinomonadaceae bacterium]